MEQKCIVITQLSIAIPSWSLKQKTTPCFLKQDFEKSASLMLTHDRGTSIDVIVAIIGPPERPECQNALKHEMTQVGEFFTFNSIL